MAPRFRDPVWTNGQTTTAALVPPRYCRTREEGEAPLAAPSSPVPEQHDDHLEPHNAGHDPCCHQPAMSTAAVPRLRSLSRRRSTGALGQEPSVSVATELSGKRPLTRRPAPAIPRRRRVVSQHLRNLSQHMDQTDAMLDFLAAHLTHWIAFHRTSRSKNSAWHGRSFASPHKARDRGALTHHIPDPDTNQ